MAHDFKVTSAKVAQDHAGGEDYIDVKVELIDGEESKGERGYAFPLETSLDEIKAELAKAVKTFDLEAEQAKVNADSDKKHEAANLTVASLLEGVEEEI